MDCLRFWSCPDSPLCRFLLLLLHQLEKQCKASAASVTTNGVELAAVTIKRFYDGGWYPACRLTLHGTKRVYMFYNFVLGWILVCIKWWLVIRSVGRVVVISGMLPFDLDKTPMLLWGPIFEVPAAVPSLLICKDVTGRERCRFG